MGPFKFWELFLVQDLTFCCLISTVEPLLEHLVEEKILQSGFRTSSIYCLLHQINRLDFRVEEKRNSKLKYEN